MKVNPGDRNLSERFILFIPFFLISAGLLVAQQSQDFGPLEQVIQGEMKDTNTPGVAVAIIQSGHVIFKKGFGVSNVEHKRQ